MLSKNVARHHRNARPRALAADTQFETPPRRQKTRTVVPQNLDRDRQRNPRRAVMRNIDVARLPLDRHHALALRQDFDPRAPLERKPHPAPEVDRRAALARFNRRAPPNLRRTRPQGPIDIALPNATRSRNARPVFASAKNHQVRARDATREDRESAQH
jgi:hypothetical protein